MRGENMMKAESQVLPPNRHVIAIFTFVTLLPLVYYIPPWLVRNLTESHLWVTVISLAIIVPIVSYVALPVFFKVLGKLKET